MPVPAPSDRKPLQWQLLTGALIAVALAIWAYLPALNGEFVFDDLHLPIMQQRAGVTPLTDMLGLRPLLMFTYWANLQTSNLDPFAYHMVNLVFHCGASLLLYFVAGKIFEESGMPRQPRTLLAGFCSVVFLLHPMQTEAVSYIAQRGESMGALFFFAAWCVFLYRKHAAITWPVAGAVVLLYLAAVATKEHTVTLPAVLLLTDWFFHPETPGLTGVRRNWRLYLPLLAGGLIGAILIGRYISRDTASIGFSLKEFTWYQYFFTEWRVFFVYLGLFLLPVWQSIDYDFAISHSPLEHGSLFALAGILAVVAAAVWLRRRNPLAAFGLLLFILMLLPTSSVIPIKDVIADRRLYLPMTGLLFFCAAWLRPFRHTAVLTAVLMLVLATGTWARNQTWSSSLKLWEDAARKAPGKQRVQFGLAVAKFRVGQCREAVEHYRLASQIEKPDYTMLMNWALAYECDQQPEMALRKMRESIALKPAAPAWASMGLLFARQGKVPEAMDALVRAQTIDASYTTTYLYRAKILQALNRVPEAIQNLDFLLKIDPTNELARQTLAQLKGQAR